MAKIVNDQPCQIHKVTFCMLSLKLAETFRTNDDLPITIIYRLSDLPGIYDYCKIEKSGKAQFSPGKSVTFPSPQPSLMDMVFEVDVESQGHHIGTCYPNSSEFPTITDDMSIKERRNSHVHHIIFGSNGERVGQLSLHASFETKPSCFVMDYESESEPKENRASASSRIEGDRNILLFKTPEDARGRQMLVEWSAPRSSPLKEIPPYTENIETQTNFDVKKKQPKKKVKTVKK